MSKLSDQSGRNIINIQEIKQHCSSYAEKQKASQSIASWLSKQFVRWIINEFPEVTEISSQMEYRQIMGQNPPDWFTKKIGQVVFYHIDPQHPDIVVILERCVEWLSVHEKKLAHKFPRITAKQVLQKWQQEHERLLKKQRYGLFRTSGEGLDMVLQCEDLHLVKFNSEHPDLRMELSNESYYMQHCIGMFENRESLTGGYGEYYVEQMRRSGCQLFSVRDQSGKPHVTISVYENDGELWVEQIKGKQNRPPIEAYQNIVYQFLNQFHVQHRSHLDCLTMGMLFRKGRTCYIEELEDENDILQILVISPHLIKRLENPNESTQWVATMRNPATIEMLPNADDAIKLAALVLDPTLIPKISFSWSATPKELFKGIVSFHIGSRSFRFLHLKPDRV